MAAAAACYSISSHPRPLLPLRLSSSSSHLCGAPSSSTPKPEKRRRLPSAALLAGSVGFAMATSAFVAPEAALAVLEEPANALSLPTWAIHVSSVVEWVTAMVLVWEYGEKSGFEAWKGLSWGMVPLLGGALCACTWHFFYNSESLELISFCPIYLGICELMDKYSPSMCFNKLGSAKAYPSSLHRRVPKRTRASLLLTSLMRRRLQKWNSRSRGKMRQIGEEMEMVNLKLYWENRSIMEENERLREKALILRQENHALLSVLLTTRSPAGTLATKN